ncbi:MAG TPA: LuxR C-terminal-related transcriptional regulator [Myxococcota bacterium]
MHTPSDTQLHALIEQIYRSAVRPEAWKDVMRELSDLFGGSPVLGEIYLPETREQPFESVGLQEQYVLSFVQDMTNYLPWATRVETHFADRFRSMSEGVPGFELEGSEFYERWMKPQGLAALWPVILSIFADSGEMVGALSVYRREGEGDFTEAELSSADALVPHFHRAFQMRMKLNAAQHARLPLADALDRLPLGMLVLDGNRQVLIANTSACRILGLQDGIAVQPTGLIAEDPRENARLHELIKAALESAEGQSLNGTSFMQIERPSGCPPFSLMVSPLLSPPSGALSSKAVVACFISDPEAGHVPTREALEKIYGLTPTEAEIVQLLTKGLSLDAIAADRKISLNTVRSHLKHVFSKTGTSRQSELLGLVMTGVVSIRSD